MKYITIKNLEKYHPGYKDRTLIWCKVYFSMINSDPEFEMLDEIDKWRFIAFVILEIQAKKPILLDKNYLNRKGFDFKKKKLEETLKNLRCFVQVIDNTNVTEDLETCDESVTQNRIDKSREEKNRIEEIYNYYIEVSKKNSNQYKLSDKRKDKIKARLKDFSVEDLKKAIDNRFMSDYHVEHGYIDLANHIMDSYEYTEELINKEVVDLELKKYMK